jgi:hypothetical protein
MTHTPREETTPDQLLDTFRGGSLKSIIVFTIIVHIVVVLASSVPYLMKTFAAGDTSKLSEQERMDIAAREASGALRDIAVKHGVKPEDLGDRFAPRAAIPAAGQGETSPASSGKTQEPAVPVESKPGETAKPESALEKEINVKQEGPALPGIDTEKEDLFK